MWKNLKFKTKIFNEVDQFFMQILTSNNALPDTSIPHLITEKSSTEKI